MRISHCTILIVAFIIICLFVFPACVKNTAPGLSFFLTIAQALVLTVLEQMFYEQGEGFYSSFLVILTSALGCLLALRLQDCNRLSLEGATLLLSGT